MRLIDADAFEVVGTVIPSDIDAKSYGMGMEYILNKIDSAPTIEERKTGEWIDDCTCSICHWIHDDEEGFALLTSYHFCPNCGASMVIGKADG